MPGPRRTRVGFPVRPRIGRRRERIEILDPSLGFDGSAPASELEPGRTPESRNFVTDFKAITPRSGLSVYGTATDVVTPVLGSREVLDDTGRWFAVAASSRTVRILEADPSPTWQTLTFDGVDTPSGLSRDYWSIDYIFNPGRSQNMVVLANNVNQPKWFLTDGPTATLSDYTFLNSFMSTAKSVQQIDDRLTFFNVRESGVRQPTRLVYTPRGLPTSDSIFAGAGAVDVPGMQGVGQAHIRDKEGLLLFTAREIFRARVRRDFFAFDFFPLTQDIGCPFPRTIANVPAGVMFVAQDLELYILSGNVLVPLGPSERGKPSRVKQLLTDEMSEGALMWATYNPGKNRYELYYKTTSGSFPRRALFYDFETGSLMQQRFTHELSHGFPFSDPAGIGGLFWDDVNETWDQVSTVWDDAGQPREAPRAGVDIMVFGSAGTSYRFRSDQTTDDGTAIDCRWRSHGMAGRDRLGFERLHEVWTEYEAASASSASVFCSYDLGTNFDAGFALSLRSSSHSVEFAPVDCEAQAPQFEFRLQDGGTPRIHSFQAKLLPSGSAFGGGF